MTPTVYFLHLTVTSARRLRISEHSILMISQQAPLKTCGHDPADGNMLHECPCVDYRPFERERFARDDRRKDDSRADSLYRCRMPRPSGPGYCARQMSPSTPPGCPGPPGRDRRYDISTDAFPETRLLRSGPAACKTTTPADCPAGPIPTPRPIFRFPPASGFRPSTPARLPGFARLR